LDFHLLTKQHRRRTIPGSREKARPGMTAQVISSTNRTLVAPAGALHGTAASSTPCRFQRRVHSVLIGRGGEDFACPLVQRIKLDYLKISATPHSSE
jgi:hypothetical protein